MADVCEAFCFFRVFRGPPQKFVSIRTTIVHFLVFSKRFSCGLFS